MIYFKEIKKRTTLEIFKGYFNNNPKKFNIFLNKLSEEKQEKFFGLSIFYRNFVKKPPIDSDADFMKTSFALLLIFSLIEALMEDKEYLTFPEFFKKKKNFKPIKTIDEFQKKEEEYYNKFGSIRKAKIFFEKYVDKNCRKLFTYAIRRRNIKHEKKLNENELVKRNIELFYKWRSNFVHSAKMPEVFQNYGIFKTKKEVYTIPYKREDFQLLFEHSFLRYFGFNGELKHKDVERKIKEYKKHTGVKIIWEAL